MKDVQSIIQNMVHHQCGEKRQIIADDADLLGIYLNSIEAMDLLVKLEERFDILFDDADLDLNNFRNINAIVEIVERYT